MGSDTGNRLEQGVLGHRALRWALALFLSSLTANVALALIGWNHTVLDFLGFRQSQTALSAQFMLGHRYAIVYETPILGPPWPIPYEFPLYQWLVAGVATLSGCGVDPCGRLVSKLFFLATLVPLNGIFRRLGVSAPSRLMIMSLFLFSPFFIFWSRTVLIESTALFFSVAYLDAVLAFRARPMPGSFVAALVLGTLAGLVKITTLAGASLLAVLVPIELLLAVRQGHIGAAAFRRQFTALLFLLTVPAVVAVAWTNFADGVKAQNPFGRSLTSTSDLLRKWNYGSWEQRLSPATWATMLERSALAIPHPGSLVLGGGVVGAIVLAGACVWATRRTKRWRIPVAACLAGYVALPLVLTNLYWFHEYYHFANHPLLLGAVGLALAAMLEAGGRLRTAALAFVASSFLVAGVVYGTYYYPIQARNADEPLRACRAVRDGTSPEDVILVLGCDWSSEVAHYSRRRALSLPDSWGGVSVEHLAQYLEPLRSYRLRALVVRGPADYRPWYPVIDDALEGLGLCRRLAFADPVFEVYLLKPSQEDKGHP
jgi:hypothetical protein